MRSEKRTQLAVEHIAHHDPVIGRVVQMIGPCGLTKRDGGFHDLASIIVRQQLSKKAADTIQSRLYSLLGSKLTPESIISEDTLLLRSAGLSGRKVLYLKNLASSFINKKLDFEMMDTLSDEDAIFYLTKNKGVGQWSAEMYLMFVMGREDILPLNDSALKTAFCELYDVDKHSFADRFSSSGEKWRPYRSYACWYLYAYLNKKAKSGPSVYDRSDVGRMKKQLSWPF